MPAKDIYHETVKNALIKDRWTITDDPLKLTIGSRSLYVDLGVEKLIAAQKDNQKIAVEIKSFISPSPIKDLENALGQYVLYQNILQSTDSERILYLAIREEVYNDLFAEPIGQLLLNNKQIKLITFDSDKQELVGWIN
ncbi:MAG: XisH family protein [Cyanobacteria bacterium P01_G01_bin.39]